MTKQANLKILRKSEVLDILNISRSTLYLKVSKGIFPPPISLGDRAIGFIAHEINETLISMINGASNDQLKTLVIVMLEKRLELGVSYD